MAKESSKQGLDPQKLVNELKIERERALYERLRYWNARQDATRGGLMPTDSRELQDLISVGPAVLRDFELLGVRSVADLARRSPWRLYQRLGRVAKQHQDICVLDTFRAAVAQARDPRLPAEQCVWWWWSNERKNRGA